MCIIADMDYALERAHKPQAFYMGVGAMHAFYASGEGKSGDVVMRGRHFVPTEYRKIPVIPTDWPSGWELLAA